MSSARMPAAVTRQAVYLVSSCDLAALLAGDSPCVMARDGKVSLQHDHTAIPEGRGPIHLIPLNSEWRRLNEALAAEREPVAGGVGS
jgi:hypothetical protein